MKLDRRPLGIPLHTLQLLQETTWTIELSDKWPLMDTWDFGYFILDILFNFVIMDLLLFGLIGLLIVFLCLCLLSAIIDSMPEFQFRVVVAGRKRSLFLWRIILSSLRVTVSVWLFLCEWWRTHSVCQSSKPWDREDRPPEPHHLLAELRHLPAVAHHLLAVQASSLRRLRGSVRWLQG